MVEDVVIDYNYNYDDDIGPPYTLRIDWTT